MTVQQKSVNELRPKDVLQPSQLEEYRKRMAVFRDELVFLHTNLSLLRQIADFDFKLFKAPFTLFAYVSRNLVSQCALIAYRLWGDTRKDSLTLQKFGEWLPDSVTRVYLPEVEAQLQAAHPSAEIEELIDRLRSIRHAALAHLSRKVTLGLETRPTPVHITELRRVADCLARYYDSANFGTTTEFVVTQLHARSGNYHEGELGYVFERLALDSNWFRIPEEEPSLWPKYRAELSAEDVEKINFVARRHRRNPIE